MLAIYILVNRHRITEGLYRLPKAYICQDLGWTLEQMTAPFAELLKAGFIKYDDKASVVLVAKALKWQRPDNPNGGKHAVKRLREVPDTPLFDGLFRAAVEYAPVFSEQLRELMPERFAQPPTLSQPLAPGHTQVSNGCEEGGSDAPSTEPRRSS